VCCHKLQGRLSFIQNGVVSKELWYFFFRNLKLPLQFDLGLFYVVGFTIV
jgi:hypothetical protein